MASKFPPNSIQAFLGFPQPPRHFNLPSLPGFNFLNFPFTPQIPFAIVFDEGIVCRLHV
ncbi:hypothetical protein CsSME_00017138 [Camellia sinensis var. sinensis]